jgi:hypothetical protein
VSYGLGLSDEFKGTGVYSGIKFSRNGDGDESKDEKKGDGKKAKDKDKKVSDKK